VILLLQNWPISVNLWAGKNRTKTFQGDWLMAITKERKSELVKEFQRTEGDSGSPDVQIAILTTRINSLTEHMRTHKKDYATRRGLLGMVSRRRSLLDYVRSIEPDRYLDLLERLNIRK